MKLRALTYGERETRDGGSFPETVTVEMTIEEAVAIADVAGNVLGNTREQASSIYDCITELVNNHWDNGQTEAMQDLKLPTWRFKPGTRDYG
ncbi:hypothetical protein SEA_TEMPO_82 [Microbacterium phage Tempo]|nr:hypothetical protein SEA_TEMPO_82 [Microbacterium phage Tempo]UOW92827.1 hypothetical protein SEA_ROBINROSE_84 [Microbacterium phage RobinRose]